MADSLVAASRIRKAKSVTGISRKRLLKTHAAMPAGRAVGLFGSEATFRIPR